MPEGTMTFEEYCRYYEDAVLSMGKRSSIKSTKSRLKRCVAEFGDKELPLSSMDIQRFITKLNKEYPAQTVHNYWGTMRTVLLRAKADGLVKEVPKPMLPKVEKEDQSWFEPEQMKALARYEPLYAVAAETGARVGELFAIQIQDFNLEEKTLNIKRNIYEGVIDTPKTRAGTRCISISSWLRDIVYREMGNRSGDSFLFTTSTGTPKRSNKETERLKHICSVYEIEPAGFHAFRRGNATLQASVIGVPEKLIAYRLGHSNLGLTLGRYAKYLVGMDKEVAEQISELLK